jgi:hypothetical protein
MRFIKYLLLSAILITQANVTKRWRDMTPGTFVFVTTDLRQAPNAVWARLAVDGVLKSETSIPYAPENKVNQSITQVWPYTTADVGVHVITVSVFDVNNRLVAIDTRKVSLD